MFRDHRLVLKRKVVRNMIKRTAFSASPDEINGPLTGVLIEVLGDKIKMVAVDTFRMAIYMEKAESSDEFEMIVPAKLLNEISKIITDDDENITIEICDRKIIFTFDNIKATVVTMNTNFIDYTRIIRRDSDIKIRVKKDELIESIDRASILTSSQNNNLIKFNINNNYIEISSLSDEGSIEEKVEVIHEGNSIEIGFNYRYIMDALKVIDDEELILFMHDSISPCIIKPLEGNKYTYLILPVRIN